MGYIDQLAAEKKAMKALMSKAGPNGENLTEAERKELKERFEKAKKLQERIDLFKGVNDLNADEVNTSSRNATTPGRLSLRSLATDIPRRAMRYSGKFGVKGLIQAGSTLVPVPIVNPGQPTPSYAGAEIPPRLVDYLPAVGREPVYDIIRETAVEDSGSAAVVPVGAEKPVKKLNLVRDTQTLKVVAVLTDEIDRFVLEDATSIRQWLGTRLTLEVINTVENEILHGDGTDTHLLGLDHVTGTQTQEWHNNIFDTIMLGINKLESIGVGVQVIALSSADWMEAQTRKDAEGHYYMSNVIDPTNRTMWGYQVAQVPGLAQGTGWVIGADSLAIGTDNMMRLEWDAATGFSRNAVRARVESRYALDVYKPHGLVKLNLTAPTSGK